MFFFSVFHIITLLTVHILHYWRSKWRIIEHLKVLKGIDYALNGFDNPFSKNLIEFSQLSLTVVSSVSFKSYEVTGIMTGRIGISCRNK